MGNRLKNQNDLELVIENAIEARILELNLSSYTEYIIPKSIGNISNLEELKIDSESLRPIYITELPESIGSLSKLESLNIIDNKLTQLPESIGNLCGLGYDIDAYGNLLTELPVSASKLKVKILY